MAPTCKLKINGIEAEVSVFERCPWCYSGDLQLIESVYESGHFICCLTCEACGPVGETPEQALEMWCYRADRADIFNGDCLKPSGGH
jgi:hypothetical protein